MDNEFEDRAFDEIVEGLPNWTFINSDVPVAHNASVSVARPLNVHDDNCPKRHDYLVIKFILNDDDAEPIMVAVSPASALGEAILGGAFTERCLERLSEVLD